MKTRRPSSQTIALPSSDASLLADLKARVRAAQVRAVQSVNRELILLYWHIGGRILQCQREEGWGAKVVERLAKDLRLSQVHITFKQLSKSLLDNCRDILLPMKLKIAVQRPVHRNVTDLCNSSLHRSLVFWLARH
jgi:uncharacterized protein DUF1016